MVEGWEAWPPRSLELNLCIFIFGVRSSNVCTVHWMHYECTTLDTTDSRSRSTYNSRIPYGMCGDICNTVWPYVEITKGPIKIALDLKKLSKLFNVNIVFFTTYSLIKHPQLYPQLYGHSVEVWKILYNRKEPLSASAIYYFSILMKRL